MFTIISVKKNHIISTDDNTYKTVVLQVVAQITAQIALVETNEYFYRSVHEFMANTTLHDYWNRFQ